MAALGAVTARAAAPFPDSTWSSLGALPEKLDSPVFALAVDPFSASTLLVGTASGTIYRSGDYGVSWKPVKSGLGRGVLSLAFNPFKAGVVLAGTRGAGAWRSVDDGVTWAAQPGAGQLSVRAFGFAKSLTAAASDRGVLAGPDAGPWSIVGLDKVRVDALAVAAVNDPSKLLAGGDATANSEPLPLFASLDGARSWSVVGGAVGGSSMVVSLTASPLAPNASNRALIMGTNTGLFASIDNGASWQPVTGGGVLPATDFTASAFVTTHVERFYVASDGGASNRGGLWSTSDGGGHFASLAAPLPEVTALAVSNDEQPLVYIATFRPVDHAVMLWAIHDTGAAPQPPPGGVPAAVLPVGPAAAAPPAVARQWLLELLTGPEAPYLALGLAAVLVLLLAGVAYIRRGRGF